MPTSSMPLFSTSSMHWRTMYGTLERSRLAGRAGHGQHGLPGMSPPAAARARAVGSLTLQDRGICRDWPGLTPGKAKLEQGHGEPRAPSPLPGKPHTHFVTTLILTPKTPVCFLDGVRFRLMSRLVNFMENSTLICGQRWSVVKVGRQLPQAGALGCVPWAQQGLALGEALTPCLGRCLRCDLQDSGLGEAGPSQPAETGAPREGAALLYNTEHPPLWGLPAPARAPTPPLGRTPFISITSMCQFLVCTACGSSCRERREVLTSPRAPQEQGTLAVRGPQAWQPRAGGICGEAEWGRRGRELGQHLYGGQQPTGQQGWDSLSQRHARRGVLYSDPSPPAPGSLGRCSAGPCCKRPHGPGGAASPRSRAISGRS